MRDDNFLFNTNFFCGKDPKALLETYGSPLYVYNEDILRARCREMAALCAYRPFAARYAVKANLNLSLMRIVREEGLCAEATSAGEIAACFAAGWRARDILFTANNIGEDEMRYAIDNGVLLSLDSVSQLELFTKINPGGRCAIRLNTGVGAGHHEKVITGGDNTKFGITPEHLEEVGAAISRPRPRVHIVGVTQHIGSHFMDGEPYLAGIDALMEAALGFDGLEFIDAGGGFGIPYKKLAGEKPMELAALGAAIDEQLMEFNKRYGGRIAMYIEPGRYIPAECGALLGTVTAVKYNGAKKYIGTDVGFNVFPRPMLYGAHHDIIIFAESGEYESATVVGNICESGDILAQDRPLPKAAVGEPFAMLDAGAYCASMASNYNNRPRPAEVLIQSNGSAKLTRRRDTYEDMITPYE